MAIEQVSKEPYAELKPIAFWQLHKNPILLRYIRSRMRWSSLSAPLIITLVVSIFTFVISINSAFRFLLEKEIISDVDTYRAAFLPVFVIQIVIMMFLGTGTVAGGITQEYDDGMVDYQRLSPMSPMAKILGYLFGLPIREWFLFGVTSIFIGIIVVRGELPMEPIWRVYSVFFISVILYHLMALVVVHSMKKKRIAGKVIQLLVVVLYFVFPMLSQFGLVFFEYLTVRPILKENILEYIPQGLSSRRLLDMDGSSSSVPFFNYNLKAWSFSMLLMSTLTISFLVMLTRRWKDVTSHLLSKPFALIFFGFFMFLLIGNTLPIAKEGKMSLTQSAVDINTKALEDQLQRYDIGSVQRERAEKRLKRHLSDTSGFQPSLDAPLAQTVFGSVCVLFACLVVYIVSPKHEKYLLGLRRARNLKKRWIPWHWDESPGWLITTGVVLMMAAPLYIFSTTLYSASTMSDTIREMLPFIPVVCIFAAVVVLVFYLVFETWENKGLFIMILFIWILPIMIATVMAVRTTDFTSMIWISGISPLAAYGYGMTNELRLPVRDAFYMSFILQLVIGVYTGMNLIAKKHKAKKALLENPID